MNLLKRAEAAGLSYVSEFDKGFSRKRCGKGFSFKTTRGATLRSKSHAKRLKALAIPPAWTDVWICPNKHGHIQATGIDEQGRKQYIYHEEWKKIRDAVKFERMELFVSYLPQIRKAVSKDLSSAEFSATTAIAAAIRLIDKTAARVGNIESTKTFGTYGVTTAIHWCSSKTSLCECLRLSRERVRARGVLPS